MLSKMARLNRRDDRRVKLSSVSTTSAPETSVPVIPGDPDVGRLSAGASFTPSPVMATVAPFFCVSQCPVVFRSTRA